MASFQFGHRLASDESILSHFQPQGARACMVVAALVTLHGPLTAKAQWTSVESDSLRIVEIDTASVFVDTAPVVEAWVRTRWSAGSITALARFYCQARRQSLLVAIDSDRVGRTRSVRYTVVPPADLVPDLGTSLWFERYACAAKVRPGTGTRSQFAVPSEESARQPDSALASLPSLAVAVGSFALAAAILAGLTAALLHAIYSIGLRTVLQRYRVRGWVRWRVRHFYSGEERIWEHPRPLSHPHTLWAIFRTRGMSLWAILRDIRRGPDYATDRDIYHLIEVQVARFAAAGNLSALYSLSPGQLCGQLTGAIQAEMDSPVPKVLMSVFAASAPRSDRAAMGAYLPRIVERLGQEKLIAWRRWPGGPEVESESNISEGEAESIRVVRQRVVFHAERGIDELQLVLRNFWNISNYAASVILGFGLLILLVQASRIRTYTLVEPVYLALGIAAVLLVPVAEGALSRLLTD